MRRALTFAGRALATAVVVVAGVALVAGVLVPRLAGATPYSVLSGSMAPRLPAGTLVVSRPSESVALGDVITYQARSGAPDLVTHRVVGVGFTADGEPRYRTQGDANDVADPVLVQPVQVRGELWYAVPFLGYVSSWLGGGSREWAAVGLAALLVGYAAWQVVQARRERAERASGLGGQSAGEESGTGSTHHEREASIP